MSKDTLSRLGIAYLETVISKKGWFLREQFVHDYGIDAFIEIVNDGVPTGQLIAVQVKTGESYFSESDKDYVVYRPDSRHISYWLNHDLPVIVFLYNPESKEAIWCPVTKETATKTGKKYKIEIPRISVLNENSSYLLQKTRKLNIEKYRLLKLLFDLEWMQLIESGISVYVEYDDWVNKSLSRTEIRIFCDDDKIKKQITIPQQYWKMHNSYEILKKYMPWADFEMDENEYRKSQKIEYENDCCVGADNETGENYYSASFEDWYESPDSFQPIYDDGEIRKYRLKMNLNSLGLAFIKVGNYLNEDSSFEWESFLLE